MRYWGFEAEGEWYFSSIIATTLMTVSIAMQIFTLWRSLRLADDNAREYGRTLNFFVISAVLLAVSMFVATLAFAGILDNHPARHGAMTIQVPHDLS
jgi:hypothetical protein